NWGIYGTTASKGTGYGVYGSVTGTSNTGYAGYFSNTITATGYALGVSGNTYLSGTTTVAGNLVITGTCTGCGGGGSSALSSITSATTTNSINNTNNAQTWAWGTLSTQTALTLTSSSVTSGTVLALANTSTNMSGSTLSVSNATKSSGYGVYSSVTGTANTGYAGYFSNTATSGANYAIYALNSSTSGYALYASGNITATTLTLTSDARSKSDVVTLEPGDALEKLSRLRPVAFTWNTSKRADMGFIAQEVQGVYPSMVSRNPDDRLSLEYTAFTAPIVAAIQQLKKLYNEIVAALDGFRTRFAALDKSVDSLKAETQKLGDENKALLKKIEDDRLRLDRLERENDKLRKAIEGVLKKSGGAK
ncbi:MAG: tail fiber domain-containing protein, partial [Bdellovibrionales bacterium]